MKLGIGGKVAAITGASEGIGKATALAFAEEKAKVAICARRKESLQKAVHEIVTNTQCEVLSVEGDMANASDVKRFFCRIVDRWGKVDILINNVGAAKKAPFEQLTQDDWQWSLATNLFSAISCSFEAVELMKGQRWGRIVNVASVSGKEPGPYLMASNAGKSALVSFSKSLAYEVAKYGILVNCVLPGRILSAQTSRLHTAEERQKIALDHIPLGRFGNADEVAKFIVFLASECSSYVTGGSFEVDGGFSKGLF